MTYRLAFTFFFRLVVTVDVVTVAVGVVVEVFCVVWITMFPVIDDRELLVWRPGNLEDTGGIVTISKGSAARKWLSWSVTKIFSLFERELLGFVLIESNSSLLLCDKVEKLLVADSSSDDLQWCLKRMIFKKVNKVC